MSERETPNERKFRVIDRRFWADDEGQEGEDESTEPKDQKPSYVLQLEQSLEEKRRQLEQCVASHNESLEEFERAKSRIEREVVKESSRIKKQVITDFLEVLDNLERALENPPEGQEDSIIEGVALVRNLFLGKLDSYGVQRIEAQGVKFDPQRHEAITAVPTDDPNLDGIVLQVIRNGYTIDDEILRPVGAVVGKLSS